MPYDHPTAVDIVNGLAHNSGPQGVTSDEMWHALKEMDQFPEDERRLGNIVSSSVLVKDNKTGKYYHPDFVPEGVTPQPRRKRRKNKPKSERNQSDTVNEAPPETTSMERLPFTLTPELVQLILDGYVQATQRFEGLRKIEFDLEDADVTIEDEGGLEISATRVVHVTFYIRTD